MAARRPQPRAQWRRLFFYVRHMCDRQQTRGEMEPIRLLGSAHESCCSITRNVIRKELAHQMRVGLAAGAHHADHGAARHHRRGRPSVRHPPLSIKPGNTAAPASLRCLPSSSSSSLLFAWGRLPLARCCSLPSGPRRLLTPPAKHQPDASHTRERPRATRRLPVSRVRGLWGGAAMGWLIREMRNAGCPSVGGLSVGGDGTMLR